MYPAYEGGCTTAERWVTEACNMADSDGDVRVLRARLMAVEYEVSRLAAAGGNNERNGRKAAATPFAGTVRGNGDSGTNMSSEAPEERFEEETSMSWSRTFELKRSTVGRKRAGPGNLES